ncbi:NAB domain-containing protein [Citrus sinensis]|uniref:kinase-interacting family protein isoform X2 n=1 Tax=Citrus sinensis TaxID=2711 RepID=UPI0021976443|nr:kinase-interacting family protein isoform X2 [Citrus sinensis]KAH9724867.1 NAB domain-containing protein [Citrus sinensis]
MSEADQTVEIDAADSYQLQPSSGVGSCSSCLLPALVDVEERMKKLVISGSSEEENVGDTFAERAEWYYQKRPQLLALLKDLYNGYITLLDRCRNHKKHHFRNGSSETIITAFSSADAESDAESTISYQQQQITTTTATMAAAAASANIDDLVAELVAKNVESEILVNQVNEMDHVCNESRRKIELLKSLMELLESERMILVNENVKLGYQVSAVMEENKGLASEAMFMRRKASELAKCVLRMREDYRVCILSQKIEDLQEQIYGLEKRNKEYYQMLVKREQQVKEYENSWSNSNSCSSSSSYVKEKSAQVTLESCFQSFEKIKLKKKKGSSNWWERVKKADFFNCGLPSCS